MIKKATLIFPHQLFENISNLDSETPIYLIEEFLFFKQYKFHNNFPVMVKIKNLPVTVLPLASVTTTVSTVVGTVAVTGLPLAS